MEFHSYCHASQEIVANMPTEKDIEKVSNIFQLISDPTRLKIVWLLCHCELCVNHISDAVHMSSPAVSHHLRLLKQIGLIESRREGKEVYYKLASLPEALLLHKSIDDIFDVKCLNSIK